METIKFDVWDYAGNGKEINEQILCEFGKVKIVLEVLSFSERNERQLTQLSKMFDVNSLWLKVNGRIIYGNKGTED